MGDETNSIKTESGKNIGLHPRDEDHQDKDVPETSEDRIRKGVALILTRKKVEEILYLHSDESLKLMHLRYASAPDKGPMIWLMFKRAPELKPYYPAIKFWCEENSLIWKDKVHNGDRYMSIPLNTYIDEITKTVLSANDAIFKVKSIYAGSRDTNLSFAISDIHHPYLLGIFGLTSGASIALLPLYEIFRLPYLGKPSILALDWPEVFLSVLILIGIIYIRNINHKKTKRKKRNLRKVILARGVMLSIFAFVFFTY